MPLKFTLSVANHFSAAMNNGNAQLLGPRKQTLCLLRQFACSYHVEKKLPPALAAMILN